MNFLTVPLKFNRITTQIIPKVVYYIIEPLLHGNYSI